jgi:hypothetical protein
MGSVCISRRRRSPIRAGPVSSIRLRCDIPLSNPSGQPILFAAAQQPVIPVPPIRSPHVFHYLRLSWITQSFGALAAV